MANEILRAALAYAQRGWPVFPVRVWQDSTGKAVKTPLTKHGFKDATTDLDQITQWWPDDLEETRGIGIASGTPSGLVILDVDPIHGGDESLANLQREHGDIPPTTLARTGSGGWHYYFRRPDEGIRNSAGGLGKGLDIRGDGGYVVAPPSSHPAGSYKWTEPFARVGLTALPQWIIDLSEKPKPRLEAARTEGSRNVALTSIAGSLRKIGLDEAGIYASLIQMGTGLPDEEIRSIAESVARYDTGGYPRTELGQAELFADLNKEKFLYDPSRKAWFAWAGHWWNGDGTDAKVYEKAGEAARYRGSVDDKDEQKFAASLESKARLAAVIDLGAKKLTVDIETLDADPLKLGVENGIVDLSSGDLLSGRSDWRITRHSSIPFHPQARAERWVRFIQEIFNGDKELIDYIWKAVGYSFTGLTKEQCWFLCFGRGANGKSTFLETLRTIAGTYGHTARVSTFTAQRNRGDANEDVASLKGARFVISGEAGHNSELDQERIKSLIGSGSTRARHLYSSSFEFQSTIKLWLANNSRPRVNDDSLGFWRRVRLIPFERQFSPGDDPNLERTLREESEGILAWAVAGAKAYLDRGISVPSRILAVTNEYREDSDHFGQFIRDCTTGDDEGRVITRDLYMAYKRWALSNGYKERYLWSPHSFGQTASMRFDREREGEQSYYKGIILKEEQEEVGY